MKKFIHFDRRYSVYFFLTAICFASIVVTILIILNAGIFKGGEERRFYYLSPRLSQNEENYNNLITLVPLRDKILNYIVGKENHVAFYIEDLQTGAWAGYKERDKFIGASLLKTPVAMMVMKKVDREEWNMNTLFTLKAELKDKSFGNLWREPDGKQLSLEELMEQMIVYSDDTAANIFINNLTGEERDNVYYHIGVVNPEAPIVVDPARPLFRKMSAKELINVYRSLYNAVYLTKKSSEYILNLLTQTKFDKSLPAGIPPDVKTAHKIGVYFLTGSPERNAHDCGIVYVPDNPFMICALTQDLDKNEAWEVISNISAIAYNFFSVQSIR